MYFCLMIAWLLSVYVSSVSLLDQPLVAFQFVALTSVGLDRNLVVSRHIGVDGTEPERFVGVYVFSVVIAAIVGIFGFVTRNAALTWAGRPTGFLDDPSMFGAFCSLACWAPSL